MGNFLEVVIFVCLGCKCGYLCICIIVVVILLGDGVCVVFVWVV